MTKSLILMLACITLGAAADTAPAVKPYPLDTCPVSGDKLGSMGDATVIVRDGQEIKLCCKGCIKDFDKNQAAMLKKIDEAAKAKAAAPGTCPVEKPGCCR